MKYRLSDSMLGIAALGLLFALLATCAEDERAVQRQASPRADEQTRSEQVRAFQFRYGLSRMQAKQGITYPEAAPIETAAGSQEVSSQVGARPNSIEAMSATAAALQQQLTSKTVKRNSLALQAKGNSRRLRNYQSIARAVDLPRTIVPQLAEIRSYRPLPETERRVERRVSGKLFSPGDAQP